MWSGGLAGWSDPTEPDPNHMSLMLRADGVAELVNVPGGQWRRTESGICWDDTDERYTGEASWQDFSERGVEVSFGDSNVIFWALPGRFGTFGWRELKMVNCDTDKVWWMSVECGSAGGVSMPVCDEPRSMSG